MDTYFPLFFGQGESTVSCTGLRTVLSLHVQIPEHPVCMPRSSLQTPHGAAVHGGKRPYHGKWYVLPSAEVKQSSHVLLPETCPCSVFWLRSGRRREREVSSTPCATPDPTREGQLIFHAITRDGHPYSLGECLQGRCSHAASPGVLPQDRANQEKLSQVTSAAPCIAPFLSNFPGDKTPWCLNPKVDTSGSESPLDFPPSSCSLHPPVCTCL